MVKGELLEPISKVGNKIRKMYGIIHNLLARRTEGTDLEIFLEEYIFLAIQDVSQFLPAYSRNLTVDSEHRRSMVHASAILYLLPKRPPTI